jgi:predicted ATP-grasp superfamily ATP-dependent carboligase
LTVLPASEEALAALGVTRPELLDKTAMSHAAREAGLLVPKSQLFSSRNEALSHARELEYPVVIKPTHRRYWAFRADHPDQLPPGMAAEGPVLVQPYIDQPQTAVSGVVWEGRLLAAVHERWLRIWPVYCGLASAAETIPPDEELEKRLLRLLSGYQGIFCAQFVGEYLIDLNLRIHSSHPLAVAAGVNLAALSCDLLRGKALTSVRARPGVFYRWLEGDVRHVLSGVRNERLTVLQALQALQPRRGTAHSTESLRDPLTMAVRIVSGITRRATGVRNPSASREANSA